MKEIGFILYASRLARVRLRFLSALTLLIAPKIRFCFAPGFVKVVHLSTV